MYEIFSSKLPDKKWKVFYVVKICFLNFHIVVNTITNYSLNIPFDYFFAGTP
jgi:hypothetical protein